MEHLALDQSDAGLHIPGFPDAVKVVRISGPKAKRLADLMLHKVDLEFADECLRILGDQTVKPHAAHEALWRSAIIHFIKCFSHSESRFALEQKKVYKRIDGAFPAFAYFESLRNKHLVHDENQYAQCLPGAVLNRSGIEHKIAKIVCLSVHGDTKSPGDFANLVLLVRDALAWVAAQFDDLCTIVTAELESRPHEELAAMDGLRFTAAQVADVHTARPAL